jgi:hypothetical protein
MKVRHAQKNWSTTPTDPHALQEFFVIVVVNLFDPAHTRVAAFPNTVVNAFTHFFNLSRLGVYDE